MGPSHGASVAIYRRAENRVLRTNCPQRRERCDRAAEETRRLHFTAPPRLQFPVPNQISFYMVFNGMLTSQKVVRANETIRFKIQRPRISFRLLTFCQASLNTHGPKRSSPHFQMSKHFIKCSDMNQKSSGCVTLHTVCF